MARTIATIVLSWVLLAAIACFVGHLGNGHLELNWQKRESEFEQFLALVSCTFLATAAFIAIRKVQGDSSCQP